MEWIILFIVSWILFLLTVDWGKFKYNSIVGLLAMAMQIFVDHQFINHNFYVINNKGIDMFGSSAYFVFGPVFVVGTLLSQYHPSKKWGSIIHLLVLTGLYSLQEYLLLSTNALQYLNWHFIDSLGVNICTIGLLCWFSIVVMERWKGNT